MTSRAVAWIVGVVAAVLLLPMVSPWPMLGGLVFVLALPASLLARVLTREPPDGHARPDVAERVVSAAELLVGEPASPDRAQPDWGAALRAELASITVPRERRRFALGAAVALLGAPHRRRSFLLSTGVAVAFGAGLLGISRAALGDDGLMGVTVLVPPVILFAVGHLCARSTGSLRFGLETGVLAAVTTLVAVAVVYGIEAAHWYEVAPHTSVLDGDFVPFDSSRAAVWDALHPVILAVHLVFWSAWPVLGAVTGARGRRPATG